MVIDATRHVQDILLFHHFRQFLLAADRAGLNVAPLKGAHLKTAVYPENVDRGVMADVDFLVRPIDFETALTLLQRQGFSPDPEAPSWHQSHETALYLEVGPGRRIMFEVHRQLFAPERFPLDHEGIWKRSVASTFDGAPCRRLAAEDHYVHVAFHAAVHRLMVLDRAVMDLEMLVRYGEVRPDAVVARAREWGMTRAVWLLSRLLISRLDPVLAETVAPMVHRLSPPAPVRAALSLLVPQDGRKTRLSHLPHRIQAALIWPLLFDGVTRLSRMVLNHPRIRHQLGQR